MACTIRQPRPADRSLNNRMTLQGLQDREMNVCGMLNDLYALWDGNKFLRYILDPDSVNIGGRLGRLFQQFVAWPRETPLTKDMIVLLIKEFDKEFYSITNEIAARNEELLELLEENDALIEEDEEDAEDEQDEQDDDNSSGDNSGGVMGVTNITDL